MVPSSFDMYKLLFRVDISFRCLTLLLALGLAKAQVPQLGQCPANVQAVPNFDLNSYGGRWYEYAKYPFIFELNGKCIYAEYSLLPDGKVSVYNFNVDRTTGAKRDIKGSATIKAPGKLLVSFPNMPAFLGAANYWILGTDYSNYAVVYSCTEVFGLFNTKVVWILTRERNPAPELVRTAMNVIARNGLSLTLLQKTDQQNCIDATQQHQQQTNTIHKIKM